MCKVGSLLLQKQNNKTGWGHTEAWWSESDFRTYIYAKKLMEAWPYYLTTGKAEARSLGLSCQSIKLNWWTQDLVRDPALKGQKTNNIDLWPLHALAYTGACVTRKTKWPLWLTLVYGFNNWLHLYKMRLKYSRWMKNREAHALVPTTQQTEAGGSFELEFRGRLCNVNLLKIKSWVWWFRLYSQHSRHWDKTLNLKPGWVIQQDCTNTCNRKTFQMVDAYSLA